MRRLSHIGGELIDRSVEVEFMFEGMRLRGYQGDTISSALAANGVRVLGRSFKYHRVRGLLSAAGHDANVLVQVQTTERSVPNVRADLTPLQSGWQITAVNTRGGLARDRLAVLRHLSPFLPVGFYYKAFYSKRWFPRWERMFRNLSGLGRVDLGTTLRKSAKRYEFCDVLVIGAGPSGLAAAQAAAEHGASVLLVDENPTAGGSGRYARGGTRASSEQTELLVAALRANPRVRIMTSTYAAGYYADHWVPLVTPEHMVKARARAVVIAQGAYEQPAVFRGNDLPGVMLASAAQRLLYNYAVLAAGRVAVLTANAEGYAAALDGLAHGIELVAVLDLRPAPGPLSSALAEELVRQGISIHYGTVPIEAVAAADGTVRSLIFECAADGIASRQQIALDGIWMSVGFAPANALLHQANASMSYAHALEQFVPHALPPGVHACGKVNGAYSFSDRVADGRDAGRAAAAHIGLCAGHERRAAVEPLECPTHSYPVFQHPRGGDLVDFDEDIQVKDIENACQEGFDSSELLKRFSTIGMGPSQGKHSNMNALRILARARGEAVDRLGTTTARPMFHPVPLALLAGRGFVPERRTALDAVHDALGAVWMPAGNWRRPEYYSIPGKSRREAIADEVRTVRTRVGMIDVGTLGKIEVHGPGAAEFLERIYGARFGNLKIGMTRYGIMLDEAGTIVDDGVIGRIGQESFYFTTTTGNSATLYREFGRLAVWWGLAVGIVNLTGHYAAFNLAGPASRAVLRRHTELDLSDEAFPYLGIREAVIGNAPSRIMRVGFVGELGYEIHLPACYAVDVCRALLASGAPFGIQPFGVEAQRMLRLEKGHLIVGQDTDGVTNALEIDAPWAFRMDKPFFIGQRSLRIIEKQPRKQTLVGFSLPPEATRLPLECHLAIRDGEIVGRVTSVGWSPTLSRCIGLALVTPAEAARGQLQIRIDDGEEIVAEIVQTPFYDAAGERQKVSDPAEPVAAGTPEHRMKLDASVRAEDVAKNATSGDAVLHFVDHSVRERFGCKGPGAQAWLRAHGYRAPAAPNSAEVDETGVMVARLTSGEFLVEAVEGGGPRVAMTRGQLASAARPTDVYPVARHDQVIGISGAALGALLRQTCSVDFAPLLAAHERPSEQVVVLTSMIGVAVVAIVKGNSASAALSLWIDPSFAHYFCTTLVEIGRDFGCVTMQ